MLTINKEFRKGILFVRMYGDLNNKTVDILYNDITSLIKDIQIRNVVFNISELSSIDVSGINALLYNYELCKKNKGISLLCGMNDLIKTDIDNSNINKYMQETTDEISAINLIKI